MKATEYELKVPAGTADVVTSRLADAPPVDLASPKGYTVRRGDTLPLIARKLHVSKADLAEANYLEATARVGAGQKLMVPNEAGVLMAAHADRPTPATEARKTVGEAGQLRSGHRLEPREGELPGEARRHARVHRAALQDHRRVLKTWNPKLSGDQVAAGQRLTVYRLTN